MTVEEIIKKIDRLVSLPDVVLRANQLLDSPESNIEEIGEVIGHDPALSAQLLKLVNSAFYNFPNQIDTISRAITLIGLEELRSLIVASTTSRCFNQLANEMIDMDTYWQRSVYCGLVAKKLAVLLSDGQGESLFLTGLLHDVGHLVLCAALPDQADQVTRQAEATGQRLTDVETDLLGFSSAELGARLLESWQLPKRLWEPVTYQLQPDKALDYPLESKILNLSIAVTDCFEPELKTGQQLDLHALRLETYDHFELTLEQLELVATDASLECFEVLAIINPQSTMIY